MMTPEAIELSESLAAMLARNEVADAVACAQRDYRERLLMSQVRGRVSVGDRARARAAAYAGLGRAHGSEWVRGQFDRIKRGLDRVDRDFPIEGGTSWRP